MNNLRNKLKNVGDLFKKIFEKFPITILIIFVTTIIYAISIDNEWISSDVLNNIGLFSILFASGSFFTETINKDKRKSILFYIISFIIAISLTYLTNVENAVFGIKNDVFIDYIIRINCCYIFSMIIASIYIQYRKSKMTFKEYVVRVFTNLFKTSITYGVLSIGALIITSIFNFLILSGKDFYISLRIEVLILGLFYLPRVLYSFFELDIEIGKFVKGLIKYTLGILLIIAFAIIYLYIGKIIILREVPSNQIFRIVASLFVIGCPIWTMSGYFKDKDILSKINSKLPILFIPFIFLQIYSIGVRIYNNGVTEFRYLAVLLIIIEIIYFALYLVKREKIGNILPVIIVAIIISTVVPYVNMFKTSQMSQIVNLRILKQKQEYSSKDIIKIKGAYNYLKNISGGKNIINNLLTEDDIEKINGLKYENEYINNTVSLYASTEIRNINIQGYNNMYFVSNYGVNVKKLDEFNNISLQDGNNTDYFDVDLSNIIKLYLDNQEDIDEYFTNHNEFEIDSQTKLIIEHILLRYNKENQEVDTFSLNGYILTK